MTVIIRWKFLTILGLFLLIFMAVQGFVVGTAHADDFTAPTLDAARIIDSNTVKLVFSEPVNGDTSDFTDFTITGEESPRNIIDGSVDGTDVVTLIFDGDPVAPGSTGTIDVNNPPSFSVTDLVGNELAPVDDFEVTDGQADIMTVYVDDAWDSVSNAGGHDWRFDAFNTIQAAIDAVAANGTVNVAAGDYNEALSIATGGITLTGDVGDVSAGPGVDAPFVHGGRCRRAVSVEASDVTIRGFKIEEDLDANCNPGIRVAGEVSGVTISDNEFLNAYKGVDLSPLSNDNTISNNLFHDNNIGLWLGGATDNTVSGNEFYDNTDSGIKFGPGACSNECVYEIDGNIIENNDLHGNYTGISFVQGAWAPTTAVLIQSNTIDLNLCSGILIETGSSGVSILGNTITNNGGECETTGIHTFSVDGITVHDNTISGNDSGAINDTGAETPLDATRNYWGAASGPLNTTVNPDGEGNQVGDDVTFLPYYTDEALTTLSDTTSIPVGDLSPIAFTVAEGDDDASLDVSALLTDLEGEIPEITISSTTSVGLVTVGIPAGTTVTGEAGWTGIIHAPTVKPNDSVTVTEGTVAGVIEVGFDDIALTFNKGVRIRIAGQGDTSIGYSRDGVFTEITDACAADDQVTGDALDPGADCKITVGSDMVVWTKHFTSFVSYTETSGGGGSGSSGISLFNQPPSGISISIDDGAATTPDADVTLSLAASNVHSMRVSNSSDLADASWEPYAATKSWTLADSAPGMYTVYAVFQSSIGLASTVVSDFITLEPAQTTPTPVMPAIIEIPSGPPEPVDPGNSITDDRNLPDTGTAASVFCKEHELIKLPNDGNPETQFDTAVYYCGHDGKRYVFPNDKLYFTWYRSFSGITIIGPEFMASLPLGKNVTYRPTSRMIKIQSEPNTYVIEPGGVLRLVPDQETARATFGYDWNTKIDDINVAFFTDYTLGAPMPSLR